MDRRLAPAILLLVLAGCGSTAGIADDTPTPWGGDVAPGVTSEGAVTPARLANAHEASLRDRSYTLRTVTNITTTRGRARVDQTLRVGADGNRTYDARYEGDIEDVFVGGPVPDRRRGWATGRRVYAASVDDGETTYHNMTTYYGDATTSAFPIVDIGDTLRRYFAEANRTSATETTLDGWRATRVRAVTPGNATTRVVATMVVDPFGLVRHLTVNAPADSLFLAEGRGRVTITLRYVAVGTTTVERPAWVERARNASGGRRVP